MGVRTPRSHARFPPARGAVPAPMPPQLVLTHCLSFRASCTVSRLPPGLGFSPCLCFCLRGATSGLSQPKAWFTGLLLVVPGWAHCPPAWVVCTTVATVTAVGWSIPLLQMPLAHLGSGIPAMPRPALASDSVLSHTPLASPYRRGSVLPRRVPVPQQQPGSLLPVQAVPPAQAASRAGHTGLYWCQAGRMVEVGGVIPNSPRLNSSPTGAEAGLGGCSPQAVTGAGGRCGHGTATAGVATGPACCASPGTHLGWVCGREHPWPGCCAGAGEAKGWW